MSCDKFKLVEKEFFFTGFSKFTIHIRWFLWFRPFFADWCIFVEDLFQVALMCAVHIVNVIKNVNSMTDIIIEICFIKIESSVSNYLLSYLYLLLRRTRCMVLHQPSYHIVSVTDPHPMPIGWIVLKQKFGLFMAFFIEQMTASTTHVRSKWQNFGQFGPKKSA